MRKKLKEFTSLGIMLMGASTIIGTMFRQKENLGTLNFIQNGELTQTSGGYFGYYEYAWSCKTRDLISGVEEVANCHDTDSAGILSYTTGDFENTSNDVGQSWGNPNTTGNDVL